MKLHDRIFVAMCLGLGLGSALLFSVCLYVTLAERAPIWVVITFAFSTACALGLAYGGHMVGREIKRRPARNKGCPSTCRVCRSLDERYALDA